MFVAFFRNVELWLRSLYGYSVHT